MSFFLSSQFSKQSTLCFTHLTTCALFSSLHSLLLCPQSRLRLAPIFLVNISMTFQTNLYSSYTRCGGMSKRECFLHHWSPSSSLFSRSTFAFFYFLCILTLNHFFHLPSSRRSPSPPFTSPFVGFSYTMAFIICAIIWGSLVATKAVRGNCVDFFWLGMDDRTSKRERVWELIAAAASAACFLVNY